MRFLLALLLLSSQTFCQSSSFDEIKFQRNLANLREQIYEDNLPQLKRMNEIWTFWVSSGADTETTREELLYQVKTKNDEKPLRRVTVSKNLKDYMTLELVNEYLALDALNDFFKENMVNVKPPFVLIPNNDLISEIKFFQLKEGDVVAEIGAGKGMFSFYLALTGLGLNISINELPYRLAGIKQTLERHDNVLDLDNIKVISGKKPQRILAISRMSSSSAIAFIISNA